MKINEVENLVGITKKNIRFYEQEELLHPQRNSENGYRDYSEREGNILRTIKMLRMMDISIEEIRDVLNNKKSLIDVLKHQIFKLEEKSKSINEMKTLCNNMITSGIDWEKEDVTAYFTQMSLMEREGHTFVDVRKKDKRTKEVTAIVSAMIIMIVMSLVIGIMIWATITEGIPIMWSILICAGPTIIIIGTVAALVLRVKEIKGGEEYEASNY